MSFASYRTVPQTRSTHHDLVRAPQPIRAHATDPRIRRCRHRRRHPTSTSTHARCVPLRVSGVITVSVCCRASFRRRSRRCSRATTIEPMTCSRPETSRTKPPAVCRLVGWLVGWTRGRGMGRDRPATLRRRADKATPSRSVSTSRCPWRCGVATATPGTRSRRVIKRVRETGVVRTRLAQDGQGSARVYWFVGRCRVSPRIRRGPWSTAGTADWRG
jgi:hypothetical protein